MLTEAGLGRELFSHHRFDPLPTQRVPFELFCDMHFWLTDPKIFLNAPLAPIFYTNYEGGANYELFGVFFQIIACGAEYLTKPRFF